MFFNVYFSPSFFSMDVVFEDMDKETPAKRVRLEAGDTSSDTLKFQRDLLKKTISKMEDKVGHDEEMYRSVHQSLKSALQKIKDLEVNLAASQGRERKLQAQLDKASVKLQ